MKRIVLMTSCVFVLMNIVSAQNAAVKAGLSVLYSNGFQKSVTGFGGGAMLEHRIAKKFSVATSIDYVGGERTATATLTNGDVINIPYKAPTAAFRPEFRYYPKAAMNGFFAAAAFMVTSSKAGEIVNGASQAVPFIVDRSDEFSAYPTLLVGLNLPVNPNLCVELSGGLGVLIEDPAYFAVPVAFRIGYMF